MTESPGKNQHLFPYGGAVLTVTALLTGIGITAIYASSSLKGAQQFGDALVFMRKQAVFAGLGFVAIWCIQKVPFRWIEKAVLPLCLFTTALLSLIFIPGMYVKVGGAERWLALPGIGGQPAELAKLAIVFFLARNLSRPSADITRFASGLLPNIAALCLFSGLILFQRDLGTPVLMLAVTALMLFAAGISRKTMALIAATGIAFVIVAVVMEPYRVARHLSFLDPWAQIKTGGFQIIQSFLAFKNGGLLGVGLGESKQKLFFLPAAETDFILSVIGEELGLLGVVLIACLFAYLAWLGFHIAFLQRNPFKKFLGFGLTALVSLQALLNMGVAMGILPTKGISLPFVSSGNSSLLVFLLLAGFLARLGCDLQSPDDPHQEQASEPSSIPIAHKTS